MWGQTLKGGEGFGHILGGHSGRFQQVLWLRWPSAAPGRPEEACAFRHIPEGVWVSKVVKK